MRYIVNASGLAEGWSIDILRADNQLRAQRVTQALLASRLIPAHRDSAGLATREDIFVFHAVQDVPTGAAFVASWDTTDGGAPRVILGRGGAPTATVTLSTADLLEIYRRALIALTTTSAFIDSATGQRATICVEMANAQGILETDPETLRRVSQSSGHRAVGGRECPRIYGGMAPQPVDSLGRTARAPEGWINPYRVRTDVALWAASMARVQIMVSSASGLVEYACDARSTAGEWKVACGPGLKWIT